jgi:hypothetical protein
LKSHGRTRCTARQADVWPMCTPNVAAIPTSRITRKVKFLLWNLEDEKFCGRIWCKHNVRALWCRWFGETKVIYWKKNLGRPFIQRSLRFRQNSALSSAFIFLRLRRFEEFGHENFRQVGEKFCDAFVNFFDPFNEIFGRMTLLANQHIVWNSLPSLLWLGLGDIILTYTYLM